MITFIVNEASGRGRGGKIWRALRREMLEQELPFRAWCTRSPGEATALAQLACQDAQELQKLVVVGGDGTVNEVLNGISDFAQIALGVVPIGSGNDFVRGLG
ncbi:MAG: acylglycerol kinase family protein, partial [Peptococcaceae bacterium]|nr:acylglycerol kinase family protein [Peptococcaceae bacterium]